MTTVEGFETPGEILGRLAAEHMARTQESRPTVKAGRVDWARVLFLSGGVAAAVIGIASVAAALYAYVTVFMPVHDTWIYELAGQRLNTGGAVYDLRPFDFMPAVDDRALPALFSPPVIVVPFRLIALFAGPGALAWIGLTMAASLWGIAYVLLLTRGWAGVVMAPLGIGIASSLLNGNVDNLILVGMLAAWRFRDDPRVGAVIGALAIVKLTPGVLVVWLIATRRWQALAWSIGAMAVIAIVTAALTDPGIWFRYLSVMTAATGAGRSEAMLAVVGGIVAILALGRYPMAAWVVAICVIPFGSPQSGPHTGILLLAAFAPLMDRWRARSV